MVSVGKLLIVGEIYGDFFDTAIENSAKRVEGIGADILIFAQTAQLSGTEMIILQKLILRDAAFLHSLPKRIVTNHSIYHPNCLIVTE